MNRTNTNTHANYLENSSGRDTKETEKSREDSSTQNNQMKPQLRPEKVIGHGAFGYVFKCYDKNRDCMVALKRTQKAGQIVSREYEVLDKLKGSANVIQMLDFFYTKDEKCRIIQNIVMEFCDESLEQVIVVHSHQEIQMMHIKHYALQMFNGLAEMHKQGIAHRDLKPENILLKSPASFKKVKTDPLEKELKICDLGAAKKLDKSEAKMNTPYVVSRYYRAPELIMGSKEYGFDIDIWAAGCILFELITRTPIFPGDQEGLMIVEAAQILGVPSQADKKHLA